METITVRKLKNTVLGILSEKSLEEALPALAGFPLRKTLNALFGLLLSPDETLKWKAVTVFGALAARLAGEDIEAARVIIRRLMWNLNDESGGIGWGAPEAMGESLSRHFVLAEEYTPMLISYLREDGNFLELEILQRGTLWAIGRVAQIRPDLALPGVPYMIPFLRASNPELRGHAVLALSLTRDQQALKEIQTLVDDEGVFTVFQDGALGAVSIKEAARKALER